MITETEKLKFFQYTGDDIFKHLSELPISHDEPFKDIDYLNFALRSFNRDYILIILKKGNDVVNGGLFELEKWSLLFFKVNIIKDAGYSWYSNIVKESENTNDFLEYFSSQGIDVCNILAPRVLMSSSKSILEEKQVFEEDYLPKCPYLNLSGANIEKDASVKSLLKGLNLGFYSQISNKRNRFKKLGFEFHESIDLADRKEASEKLISLHIKKWKSEGKVSRYSQDKNKNYIISLLSNEELKDRIRLFSLKNTEGDVAAIAYCMISDKTLLYCLPTFDIEYQKNSPGRILLSYILELAFREGFEKVDFGPGIERYKLDWSNGYTNRNIIFKNLNKNLGAFVYVVLNSKLMPFLRKRKFYKLLQSIKADLILRRYEKNEKYS